MLAQFLQMQPAGRVGHILFSIEHDQFAFTHDLMRNRGRQRDFETDRDIGFALV